MSKAIYFLIFSDAVNQKKFSLDGANPGIGGTEFTSIRLALNLAKSKPEWDIVLVNSSKINIEASHNIQQVTHKTPSDFFNDFYPKKFDIIIANITVLNRVQLNLIKKFENYLVGWSRHPFDFALRELVSKVNFRAIVCVGIYQYFSNKILDIPVHNIQDIFVIPSESLFLDYKDPGNKKNDFVYLGALIPGKGFVEVAKAWKQLKKQFPGVKLHVIGSAATYGSKLEFDLVPASPDYAKEILKYIPEADIHNGEVVFYGNLGEEKFDIIKRCDLAILNPTGFTEAFPASPLECMACGVPVIASDDYGMSDCMRFFPELVINGHQNIAERVEWLLEDPLRYRELQQRSISVAQWFASQKDQIITRWIRLIEAVAEGKTQELRLDPVMPFYGSKSVLIYRRDIRPKLAKLNRYRRTIMKTLSWQK